MEWHNILFNSDKQVGSGEYTFTWNNRIFHGIAIVKLEAGKIHIWREYQYRSDKKWLDFIGSSEF